MLPYLSDGALNDLIDKKVHDGVNELVDNINDYIEDNYTTDLDSDDLLFRICDRLIEYLNENGL